MAFSFQCLGLAQSAIKFDKCHSSLRRHNAVSAALEALGSAIVHPMGHPISHSTKAGFKRRGKVGSAPDDFSPGWVCWAGGENRLAGVGQAAI